MSEFSQIGLKEMWPQYGTGTNQCLISIHILCAKIGDNIRISLLKAHIITGSDVTSKVGTKAAALKKIPEFCLVKLGDKEVEGEGFRDAERYLVNVLQTNSQCTTFDELRYVLYTEKGKSLPELPPTSLSIYGHLLSYC